MKTISTEFIENITPENYDKVYYRKQENFRKAFVVFAYTHEELLEYSRCANDIIYFVEKYCTVNKKNIKLYDFQKDILIKFKENRFNAVKNARQSGLNMIISLLALHESIFNTEKMTVIVGNKMVNSKEILERIKRYYSELPYFMKPGIISSNITTIKFDNYCNIRVIAASPSIGIGYQIHNLFIQDFAYINETYLSNFYRSIVPCISSLRDGKMFIQSNGHSELFDEIIENGLLPTGDPRKNNYNVTSVYWWQIPNRDEEWAKNQIKILGKDSFDSEYGLL